MTSSRPWPADPREFILAYLDAWNEADVERVIDAYHVPSLIHAEGVVRQQLTGPSRLDFLGSYVDSTREALAAGAHWTCRRSRSASSGPMPHSPPRGGSSLPAMARSSRTTSTAT